MNPQMEKESTSQVTMYSHPTYPKYPEILKQGNIRCALTKLERQRHTEAGK